MPQLGDGKKPVVYDDPCVDWLLKLSKAALVDCVVDLLRAGGSNSADDPVGESSAVDRLSPVLQLRGDKIPLTEAAKCDKRIRKLRARRIFNTARAIAGLDNK